MNSLIALILASLLISPLTFAATTIKVGGKDFTEQIIMTELTAQYLEEKGFKVVLDRGLKSGVLRKLLVDGDIDLYWEYTGTAYLNFQKQKYNGEDRNVIYQKVKLSDKRNDLVWLNNSTINNTYALAISEQFAEEINVSTLDELAAYQNTIGGLKLASNNVFLRRDDGLTPFQREYGFEFSKDNIKRIESGLVYAEVGERRADVGLVFSTDGRIISQNLIVLEDTRNFFPPYELVPVVRKDVLQKNPGLEKYLNDLSEVLDTKAIAKLNYLVDVDKVLIWEAVEEFLISKDLL
ncbi:MAG: glycine betaine ABC transporter substrate-binding protein [Arenicella sp.]